MQDILGMLNKLRRPGLLIRTARIGVEDYRRDIHLARLLGMSRIPRHGQALMHLMEIEDSLNEQRRNQDTSYSVIRHIEVLIAMMGEAQIMRNTQCQTNQ